MPLRRINGLKSKGVVMIAHGASLRVVAIGLADQEFCPGEATLEGIEHFILHGFGGRPVGVRIRVPFAPKAQDAGSDEGDARVAVVTATESSDEVSDRLPEQGVFVIR